MNELIFSLIPLAIAACLQPPQLIAQVIFMQTKRGFANGWAYFIGITAFRLTLGGLLWLLISKVEETVEASGNRFDIFVGAVLIVLGLVLLIFALRQALNAPNSDEPALSWTEKLQTVKPYQAFLIGISFLALDPKDWLVDFSAVDLIAAADLTNLNSLISYLVYTLMAQSLLLAPLVLVLFSPIKGQEILDRLKGWLERNERIIMVSIAILLGCVFIFNGLARLGVTTQPK